MDKSPDKTQFLDIELSWQSRHKLHDKVGTFSASQMTGSLSKQNSYIQTSSEWHEDSYQGGIH